jgi:hypothetical protein
LVKWLTNLGWCLIVNIVYRVTFNASVTQKDRVRGKAGIVLADLGGVGELGVIGGLGLIGYWLTNLT